jgi:ABC-2 type transporter
LFLTALNEKFRDFRYVIPFIVQFGLFIAPVGFSSDVIPDKWRLLYFLNPIVGIIDGFRWAICRGASGHLSSRLCSLDGNCRTFPLPRFLVLLQNREDLCGCDLKLVGMLNK